MVPLGEKTVWKTPPGQDGPEADRRSYCVEVPTYYSSVSFRDDMARFVGLPPRPAELMQEIAAALEELVADADQRAADRILLSRVIMAETAGIQVSPADRRRLGVLREIARRSWEPYRAMEAREATHDEYRTLELVRRFVIDWRGLWSSSDPEAAEQFTAERNGLYLTHESLERIPLEDLVFLRLEIERMSAPRGASLKNSERPLSSPTTATPSTTARNTRQKTRRPKAKAGSSRTSKAKAAARSA